MNLKLFCSFLTRYVFHQYGLFDFLFILPGVQCMDKWTLRVFMGYDDTFMEHTAYSC